MMLSSGKQFYLLVLDLLIGDSFASFFTGPLLSADATNREMNAVNSGMNYTSPLAILLKYTLRLT
jgi:hypothetical protein